ncbi:MAG: ABC transporter ATP-binding protein [Sphaerochaetaceae bacterium]|nr:ABC transporter ATP-binding protein [Sphaerochaetaceae bacterium]
MAEERTIQIELKHVTKRFTTKTLGEVTAVNDFNLKVYEGECFSILGPSGCGKSTTLRMIAGFEDLSEGEIYLSGEPVSIKKKNLYVPPEDRGLGMVFQAFAVWPHMNVYKNVALPLKVAKVPKEEIKPRVMKALKHCSLDGLEKVYPSDLSGGQQQRIALARAIVINPKILLLDEPLSNLDPKLRETMRFEIKKLQQEFNFTIIFVTHDQSEAMALSDRMMVMDMGNIQQVGTPTELYNKPINKFVHSFLGQSNFTQVIAENGKVCVKGCTTPLPVEAPKNMSGEILLATRPNTIEINHSDGYKAKVIKRVFLTDFSQYLVDLGGGQIIRIQTPHRNIFRQGDDCYVKFPSPMWYEKGEEDDAERAKRMVI